MSKLSSNFFEALGTVMTLLFLIVVSGALITGLEYWLNQLVIYFAS